MEPEHTLCSIFCEACKETEADETLLCSRDGQARPYILLPCRPGGQARSTVPQRLAVTLFSLLYYLEQVIEVVCPDMQARDRGYLACGTGNSRVL